MQFIFKVYKVLILINPKEYNVQLVNLQKKASGLQAKTLARKTYRNNLKEKLSEKK